MSLLGQDFGSGPAPIGLGGVGVVLRALEAGGISVSGEPVPVPGSAAVTERALIGGPEPVPGFAAAALGGIALAGAFADSDATLSDFRFAFLSEFVAIRWKVNAAASSALGKSYLSKHIFHLERPSSPSSSVKPWATA